jgi:plasmid stability protein
MASLAIRNLDEVLTQRLRMRAAEQGRSMEEEARVLLREALAEAPKSRPAHLVDLARSLFGPRHGVGLVPPKRRAPRPAPDFKR